MASQALEQIIKLEFKVERGLASVLEHVESTTENQTTDTFHLTQQVQTARLDIVKLQRLVEVRHDT